MSTLLTDLSTHRDRAILLAMALGGLPSAEARSLRLADVDFGLRRLQVMGGIRGSWYLSEAAPRLEARGLDMLLVPNAVS